MTDIELLESELREVEITVWGIEHRLRALKNSRAGLRRLHLVVGRYPSLRVTREAAVGALESSLMTYRQEMEQVKARLDAVLGKAVA